ncbi:TPA: hypothetical protein DIS55_02880 [Candidatus Kaiserbacteria bacterium]|uniref:Uncharacterized protein n=1 Tax=Candidatus Kaiserbacteria bacterium RIFCSPLOWO2_12_FULL_50_28 TaxID=1798527 RepID=A0A1F6FLJ0_9BACT|nr:MAG: hypothetical protein A3H15_01485 [Candidatus Kaiserbacteria bacterium RIFCSPLOWO2_12_FULL_50_28]HCM43873.1 hypothetical protein [Candidatus Kaiserbacteria bacterium]
MLSHTFYYAATTLTIQYALSDKNVARERLPFDKGIWWDSNTKWRLAIQDYLGNGEMQISMYLPTLHARPKFLERSD